MLSIQNRYYFCFVLFCFIFFSYVLIQKYVLRSTLNVKARNRRLRKYREKNPNASIIEELWDETLPICSKTWKCIHGSDLIQQKKRKKVIHGIWTNCPAMVSSDAFIGILHTNDAMLINMLMFVVVTFFETRRWLLLQGYEAYYSAQPPNRRKDRCR